MKQIAGFFRLIRLPNLLIVVITQCFMRWCIISPILSVNNFTLQFSDFLFAMLVLSTVLLTAAGYVINDYFDTKTDLLNRPDTVVIGRYISRRVAMILHFALSGIGVLLGFYVSYKIGLYQLGILFLVVSGLLWYYSTTYKRQFLVGNLIVALLTAIVPFMVVLYEIPTLNEVYKATLLQYKTNFNNLFAWIAGFSFFAFLTTLIREIIKDIEDFEGDNAYGRDTLPVVLGIFITKIIVVILIFIVIGALAVVYLKFMKTSILTFWYFVATLVVPLLYLVLKVIKAEHKNDYHFASLFTKVIMLMGLLYSLVARYIFLHLYQ